MGACRVFITVVTVCMLFCAFTVQGSICTKEFGNWNPNYRPDGYWDICSRQIDAPLRNQLLEKIINASVSYHYATSHNHDDVSLLKRINVTEVALVVNSVQVRPGEIDECLYRQQPEEEIKKNTKQPHLTRRIGLIKDYISAKKLITFAASGSHTSQSRILTVAIRLPLIGKR
ncbi:envelope protein UL131A [macacine betaherpesvirus 3]|uniref:Rh157.6 n=1 Tax=Rhesus cytomegalovirus (strain 68-1) TaxID=47929 RepID=I3WEY2_RHCM6|nr:Rh157.6 [macacine betaherpesvirus 3]QMS44130.1 Rh157.6 [synthetic construct]QQL10446.1 Rh157..6 [macacine betaherpesvirus 3]QQL10625.1 Rh157.6 [Rhesus cytomegalovirus strain 68-1.2]QQL10804.1 Rh157.6 [Rhesus cytomegalovirus strain 68-1_FL]